MWPNFSTNNQGTLPFLTASSQTSPKKWHTHSSTYMQQHHRYTHTTPKQEECVTYKQGLHSICHVHPGMYYISDVRTVPQTSLLCASWFESSEDVCNRRIDHTMMSQTTYALLREQYGAAQPYVNICTLLLAQWQMIAHATHIMNLADTALARAPGQVQRANNTNCPTLCQVTAPSRRVSLGTTGPCYMTLPTCCTHCLRMQPKRSEY